jgi:Chaperone of endosialidase
MKTKLNIICAAFTIASFALLPIAQAVVPAPDGGYPGGNTAEGQTALLSLTSGGYNTAVGYFSLRSNTTGSFNTALGAGTLLLNTGTENTATGTGALLSNTSGATNTADGAFALVSNTTGFDNTAAGSEAMYSNVDGNDNVAIGFRALKNHTTGNYNIAIGTTAGGTGAASNTIHIGFAGFGDDTSGRIRIGTPGTHTSTIVSGILGAPVLLDAVPVYVDANNQLGTVPSSRRFKTDITDMAAASEAILSMRPVTFHFKAQNAQTRRANIAQFGLIAEEVAEVNPDLVMRDPTGEIYSVRYEAINAMLLNEFLKEHRKVEAQSRQIHEQEARIAQQQSDFEAKINKLETLIAQQRKETGAFTARLDEQAAQITKVNSRIDWSRPALQEVALDGP